MGFGTYNLPQPKAHPGKQPRPMIETRIVRYWILGKRNPAAGVPYLPRERWKPPSLYRELQRIENLLEVTFTPLTPPCTPS